MSDYDNFEDFWRSVAGGLGDSLQQKLDELDLDGISTTFGVDSDQARDWIDGAASWMRTQFDARAVPEPETRPRPERETRPAPDRGDPRGERRDPLSDREDPLRAAAPHPLDLPTDEQGAALAALDSGRWIVESGSNKLAPRGEGPAPSDALGLVRELRVRDWIAGDGEITLAGRHALSRWLDAATSL
jgi:hypothetical protein